MTSKSGAVVAYVQDRSSGVRAPEVAAALGMAEPTARRLLAELAMAGEVARLGQGLYGPASPPQGAAVRLSAVPAAGAGDSGEVPDVATVRPVCPFCSWRAAQPVPAGEQTWCEACGYGMVAEADR